MHIFISPSVLDFAHILSFRILHAQRQNFRLLPSVDLDCPKLLSLHN